MAKFTGQRDARRNLEWLRDTILLSFARFSQSFAVTVYGTVIPYYLLSYGVEIWVLSLVLGLEYLVFAFLSPAATYLLDSTRTAVGRRTPYILVFGVVTPFLMGLSQSSLMREMLRIAIVYVALFNLSLFIYSMSFQGLVRDKLVSLYESFQRTAVRLSAVFGVLLGLFALVVASDVSEWKKVLTFGGLLWLVSSVVVSFLVTERKEYRTKLTEVERMALQDKLYAELRSTRLKNLFKASIDEICLALLFAILLTVEGFTLAAWTLDANNSHLAVLANLTYLVAYAFFAFLFPKFRRTRNARLNVSTREQGADEKRDRRLRSALKVSFPLLAAVNGSLYLFLNFAFRANAFALLITFLPITGIMWAVATLVRFLALIPGRAERELIYESAYLAGLKKQEVQTDHLASQRFALILFTTLLLIGLALTFAGLENIYALLSVLSFALSVLLIFKPY